MLISSPSVTCRAPAPRSYGRKCSLLVAGLAVLGLAGCDYQGQRITAVDEDPQAAVLAERAPVTLPPAIASSVTYRCADSRLIYVDYFTDDRAMVRVNGEGAPVILAGQGDRRSYSGSGYALDRQASDIRFTSPDIGTGLCKSGVPA